MRIRCPLCARSLTWETARVVVIGDDGRTSPYVPGQSRDPADRRAEEERLARVCAGGGLGEHFLPYGYGHYGPPVVIGVVGQGSAGKTHLLAAMVRSFMHAGRTGALPLRVDPLDLRIHRRFEQRAIVPFLEERRVLPITPATATIELTDALRVYNPRTRGYHAVVFFDVGGERLEADRDNHFLRALNALLFVVDGELLLGRRGARGGDRVFGTVISRLTSLHGYTRAGHLALPAALVVAKADRLRFLDEPDVNRWFAHPDSEQFDLDTVEDESRDVHRLLSLRGPGFLGPASVFLRSSLHLASAAGASPMEAGERFRQRGFGPRRTVKPLLWLLAQRQVLGPAGGGQRGTR
ncbi:hypothetical protein GCM10023259_027110 [Thermocatellispora tengchongensis]